MLFISCQLLLIGIILMPKMSSLYMSKPALSRWVSLRYVFAFHSEVARQLHTIEFPIIYSRLDISKITCIPGYVLEATPRFELGDQGLANLSLTTWPYRHLFGFITISDLIDYVNKYYVSKKDQLSDL